MTEDQAYEAGKKARANRLGGWQNPHSYFRHPELACAWDDGWHGGKRTAKDTLDSLATR